MMTADRPRIAAAWYRRTVGAAVAMVAGSALVAGWAGLRAGEGVARADAPAGKVAGPAPGRVESAAPQVPDHPPVAEVREAFRKLLERPRVAPDAKSESVTRDGRIEETGSFASEAGQRVPFLAVRSERDTGRLPVVICQHGTGGNKESLLSYLRKLADRGFLGISIDARHQGARIPGGAKGAEQYNDAVIRAWRAKPGDPVTHPFWYDTAFDLWRMVDYLETRADVDAKRIGMFGISMGGIQIWLAASVDERVAVSVPVIAVQSMRWMLENDRWQARAGTIKRAHEAAAKDLGEPAVNARVCRELWAKIIPGITDRFDCPSMIRLFAPRPLLILSGAKDRNCPLPGAEIAIRSAEAAYTAAGAKDALKVIVDPDAGHEVTPGHMKAADDWLDRHLKPARPGK